MQKISKADKALMPLRVEISDTGFCFVASVRVREWLMANNAGALDDWDIFSASWGDMPQDQYMADGGRYRRRRHATLSASAGGKIKLEPHQPHFQSLDYNPLNGGVAREYAPIVEQVLGGNTMTSILQFGQSIFSQMMPEATWHIEAHQFRIEASPNQSGKPTPEGVHRDGVDFVLVVMVNRVNISSGTTTLHDLDKRELSQFTLTAPLDCAIVDDRCCMHGVTEVWPLNPREAAYRDVLVITFTNTANT